MKGSIDTVKLRIQRIRFGILKTSGMPLLSIPISFMIETLRFTDDNYLWCTTSDLHSSDWMKAHNVKVKLKFIRKADGLFIKLCGRAEIITTSLPHSSTTKNIPNREDKQLLVRVKIEEVQCFQKKSTSPYTSFLQSVNNYAVNKALISRGA